MSNDYGYADMPAINAIVNGKCNCEVRQQSQCWAMDMINVRFKGLKGWKDGWYPERLNKAKTTGPAKVIPIQYLGDIAHDSVDGGSIRRIFLGLHLINERRVRSGLGLHTFLILTKYPKNLLIELEADSFFRSQCGYSKDNFYIGISATNQKTFDERIQWLVRFKKAGFKTWVSLEPLHGAINMKYQSAYTEYIEDQVIVGDDSLAKHKPSGKDYKEHSEVVHITKPVDLDWIRSIRDQCKTAGVPCFIKQIQKLGKDKSKWLAEFQVQELVWAKDLKF